MATVSVPLEEWERLEVVLAAARSNDVRLVKLALDNYDKPRESGISISISYDDNEGWKGAAPASTGVQDILATVRSQLPGWLSSLRRNGAL